MAILTNLDAIRGDGLDELIRRVHHDKTDYVIEDQTMPVAAVIDINKYQLLTDLLQRSGGSITIGQDEPLVRGSDISIREIAERHVQGDSIEDLRHRFPQLNPAQIYSALAYYYEHADEIDRLITERRMARGAAEPGASVKAAEERRAGEAHLE
jgi:uncharacterized protein (DUF433 family)/PHD/YefM family antitoxin component YafN of YafNO toxin-antitoxin module